jgi:hypothetical protein
MSLVCYEKDGELVCERDIDVALRELKDKVVKEVISRIVDDLEVEMDIPGIGKVKAVFKLKRKLSLWWCA